MEGLSRSTRAPPEQPSARSAEWFWRRLRSGTSGEWFLRGAAAAMELIMSSANDYGEHYWCVTGDGGSVFVYADRIEITACGALTAWGGYRKEGTHVGREQQLWAAASGQWKTFFAASLIDGR